MARISSGSASTASTGIDRNKNYTGPLVTVTILFFMWGFITCLNDILIPKLQAVFTLQHWQAMLIQTAFFGAYFIVSLIYFILSATKGDPILKIGYKKGIILGLAIAAVGCALFLPAANMLNYGFFLLALFVLASGIAVLQITANPYVAILGPPENSSSRMNLSQALNSLGTTLAPLIGGYLIFNEVENIMSNEGTADSVILPYIGLAAVLLVLALLISFSKLPNIQSGTAVSTKFGALRERHLILGMLCIFAYVGGEVAIGSTLIGYLKLPQIAGLPEAEAKYYLAFYWGGAMIGRFFGAVALARFSKSLYKYLIIAVITSITFITIFSIYDLQLALITLSIIVLNIIVLLFGKFIPNRTLGLFAATALALLAIGIFTEGALAMWSVIAVGLFNSIMFPTIFDLAIKGLGSLTGQGSSLLVMAIVGGAIIPPLQGLVADLTGDLQFSFFVPLLCYLYIAFYGFFGYRRNFRV